MSIYSRGGRRGTWAAAQHEMVHRRRTLKRRDLQCTLRTVSRLLLCDAAETTYLQKDGVLLRKNYLEIEKPQV